MPKRRKQIFPILLACNVAAFAGCASTRENVGGWFGASTPAPVSRTAETSVYYAGTDGMKVFGEPSASSKVVARLGLHEKVNRFKLEGGYAYVESVRGAKGWVNNAQLIWRLPGAPAAVNPSPVEPATEEPPVEASQEERPTPTSTPAPDSPEFEETPAGVAPSLFDAY